MNKERFQIFGVYGILGQITKIQDQTPVSKHVRTEDLLTGLD